MMLGTGRVAIVLTVARTLLKIIGIRVNLELGIHTTENQYLNVGRIHSPTV